MRFFTREWLSGELTDAAFDAVPAAYRLYLATLRLPPDVLALSEVDLHDGLMLDIKYAPESEQLHLYLRCGDLQQGYFDLYINYSGACLDDPSLSILRHAMQAPKAEFLYDEVDRAGDHFEHQFILSSRDEACVSFTTVTVSSHFVRSRSAV